MMAHFGSSVDQITDIRNNHDSDSQLRSPCRAHRRSISLRSQGLYTGNLYTGKIDQANRSSDPSIIQSISHNPDKKFNFDNFIMDEFEILEYCSYFPEFRLPTSVIDFLESRFPLIPVLFPTTRFSAFFMKTILITGAAGFIGSHTVDRLLAATDCHLIAVDDLSSGTTGNLRNAMQHSRFRFQRADIREPGTLDTLCDLHRPTTILHLAGSLSVRQAEEEPAQNFDLNLGTTHLVAEAARKNQVQRIVFASSAACYGESRDLPLTEDQTAAPISMYGTAKLASEQLLAGYSRSYGIETTSLRYFNVYGDRQNPKSPYSGVVSRFAEAFASGHPPTLFGNGTQTRDFVSVLDVARANAIAASATRLPSGIRNICTGQRRSLLDLLGIFQALTPGSPTARFAPARRGDIQDSCGDTQRARNDLGFRASITLEQGLRRLIISNRKQLASA